MRRAAALCRAAVRHVRGGAGFWALVPLCFCDEGATAMERYPETTSAVRSAGFGRSSCSHPAVLSVTFS